LANAGIESDEALLSTDEATIKKLCSSYCFDLRAVLRRLRTNNRTVQLLEAHLALDHVLTLTREQQLQREDVLRLDRWGFAQKLELLSALGAVSLRSFDHLKLINALRNKVAHRFEFRISDDDVQQVLKEFPEGMLSDTSKKDKFWKGLGLVIIALEQERQTNLHLRINLHRALVNLRKAVYSEQA
jgi:hypothetical protein